ncbi:MAG: pirin family protein [Actinomycetota bacterium]
MTDRTIRTLARPTPQAESGILHPFPSPELAHIDPFVFLDMGAPTSLGGHAITVKPHAHRGVQPVGLVFRGRVEHRDSLGNDVTVTSGGMQWLVGGSGALHEEILHDDDGGVFHLAQLWVNMAADRKMDPPEHHAITADRVPTLTRPGATVRLFAGTLDDRTGPAPLGTPVLVAHVALAPGGALTVPVPTEWNAAVISVADRVSTGGADLDPGHTAVLNADGASMTVTSAHGGEALVLAGLPIGEPIVMGRGHVMTSDDDVGLAIADEQAGRMGRLAPRAETTA